MKATLLRISKSRALTIITMIFSARAFNVPMVLCKQQRMLTSGIGMSLLNKKENTGASLSAKTVARSSNSDNSDSEVSENNQPDDSPLSSNKTRRRPRAIRQHVNPLSVLYQKPIDLPEGWVKSVFAKPSLPFQIDIGSARGRFCIDMALINPDYNFLGLEIRRPCIDEAFKKMEKYGAKGNVHFLPVNANVDLHRIVQHIQEHSEILRYTVQFPDPHFKAKHKKRRMVQAQLVKEVCESLKAGVGEVFIQSDLEEVALAMREEFSADPLLEDLYPPGEWMPENFLGVSTEREKLTLSRGDPVYRTLFRKK